MAYTKTVWENGSSAVNATNMNHIEQGIYDNSLKTDEIGDLTNLDTFNKTNIVSAINNIVASGTGYIKYLDGTMICYGSKSKTLNIGQSWGSLYSSGNGTFVLDNFAQEFISTPVITYSTDSSSSVTCWASLDQDNPPSTTSPGGVQLIRATSTTNSTVKVNYIAIGKWK